MLPCISLAMDFALHAACDARSHGDVPIGASIFDPTGKFLSALGNRRELDCDPTAHAEILVLRAAAKKLGQWRLNECTLVVTLEPCPMCFAAISDARISFLIFGAYRLKSMKTTNSETSFSGTGKNVIGGYRRHQCTKILSDFFSSKR